MELSEERGILIHAARQLEALVRKYFTWSGSGIYERDISKSVLDALPISILWVRKKSGETRPFDGTASEGSVYVAVANVAYPNLGYDKNIFRVDLDEEVPIFDPGDIIPVLYRHPAAPYEQWPGVAQYITGNFFRMQGNEPLYDMGAPVFDCEAFFRNQSIQLALALDQDRLWRLPPRIAEIGEICRIQRGYHKKTYPGPRDVARELQKCP